MRTWALVAALLVGPPGCAFIPESVSLDSLTINAPRKGGRGREVVVFPAVDARPSTTGCGAKRNGMLLATARITCKPEPKDWLGYLVLSGLQQAGFHLVTTQTAKSPDPLRLRLTLKQLFLDMHPNDAMETLTLTADVHVLLQAEAASGLAAERSFFVAKRQDVMDGPDLFHQPGKFDPSVARGQVMDEATRELVAEIVNAVVNLADRYPTIGTVPGATISIAPAAVSAVAGRQQ